MKRNPNTNIFLHTEQQPPAGQGQEALDFCTLEVPLRMALIYCPEMSVRDLLSMLRYIPEERRSRNKNPFTGTRITTDRQTDGRAGGRRQIIGVREERGKAVYYIAQ